MGFCIAYENGADGVALVFPSPETLARLDAQPLAEGQEPGPDYVEPLTLGEFADQVVPRGVSFELIQTDKLPVSRCFRAAWCLENGSVVEQIEKSRMIAHERRRSARSDEFAPWDTLATVPSEAERAETERAAIRAKYDQVQLDLDAAQDVDALRALVAAL